jgi:hypothetical protein
MREPQVTTLAGASDEVVLLVMSFINDAKRKVEDAWRWSALQKQWDITTAADDNLYSLTGSGNYAIIDTIHNVTDKYTLKNYALRDLRKILLSSSGSTDEHIVGYAVDGHDASGDVQIRIYPTPSAAKDLTVYGWSRTADMSIDADSFLVPSTPVIYEALAYALRERGEVGGQTAAEVMGMAKMFLNDAIAHDSSLNFESTIWELD